LLDSPIANQGIPVVHHEGVHVAFCKFFEMEPKMKMVSLELEQLESQ
jgi:hypothetical protein